jgi:hypothetical protein
MYLTNNKETCEVVVQPETPENIQKAIEECTESGIKPQTAQHIGNFAIDLSGDLSIADVRSVINGQVIEG